MIAHQQRDLLHFQRREPHEEFRVLDDIVGVLVSGS